MTRSSISNFKDVLHLPNYRRAAYVTCGYGSEILPFSRMAFVFIVYQSNTNDSDTLIEFRTFDGEYAWRGDNHWKAVQPSKSWFEAMFKGSKLLDNMVEIQGHILFKDTKKKGSFYPSDGLASKTDLCCFTTKYGYALATAAKFPTKFKNLDEAMEAYNLAEKVDSFKWSIHAGSHINLEIEKCRKEIQSARDDIARYDGYITNTHNKYIAALDVLNKYGLKVVDNEKKNKS